MSKSELLKSLGFRDEFLQALDDYDASVSEIEVHQPVFDDLEVHQAETSSFFVKVTQPAASQQADTASQ